MLFSFLLQSNFLPQADTSTIYITVGIFGVLILFLIIGSFVNSRGSSSSGRGPSKPLSPRAGRKKFIKVAKKMGLTPMQIKLLEEMAVKYRISSPFNFISSPNTFNIAMKKAIQEYDSGAYAPQVKENYKMLLFSIRQKFDRNSGGGTKIGNSRQLAAGKQVTVATGGGERYTSQITANLKDSLCVAVPLKSDGTMLRLAKWEPVTVSLWEKGDRGYTFASKVMGYTTMKNASSMMLQHSNSISSSKQRFFPRKELGRPCYFFKINIATIGKGRTEEKKAVINDKKGRLGTVIEISAGGCSIKSSNALQRGELLKIDIDIEKKKTMSVLGKIVNLRREGPGNSIMHVQFTKMSKNNMNSINSYVYGIGEKNSILDY